MATHTELIVDDPHKKRTIHIKGNRNTKGVTLNGVPLSILESQKILNLAWSFHWGGSLSPGVYQLALAILCACTTPDAAIALHVSFAREFLCTVDLDIEVDIDAWLHQRNIRDCGCAAHRAAV